MEFVDSSVQILVALTVICHLFVCLYVFWNEYRYSGSIVTLGNFTVLKFFFIPVVIVGFVAASDRQGIGYRHIFLIQQNMGKASLLSLAAIIPFLFGYIHGQKLSARQAFTIGISNTGRVLKHPIFIQICCGISFLLMAVALAAGARFGQFRHFASSNSGFAPLLIVLSTVSSFAIIAIIARLQDPMRRARSIYIITALALLIIVSSSGTRTALLNPIVIGLSIYLQTRGQSGLKISLLFAPALIAAGLFVSSFRQGLDFSMNWGALSFAFLYGENFPDFRNVAWLLSYLPPAPENGMLGTTILSSLISFIPSSLLEWRDAVSWGNIVPSALSLDPRYHPGVRGLPFTEWYFNFGMLGLVFSSYMLGIVIRVTSFCEATKRQERAQFILGGYFLYRFLSPIFSTSTNLVSFYPLLFIFLFVLGLIVVSSRLTQQKSAKWTG